MNGRNGLSVAPSDRGTHRWRYAAKGKKKSTAGRKGDQSCAGWCRKGLSRRKFIYSRAYIIRVRSLSETHKTRRSVSRTYCYELQLSGIFFLIIVGVIIIIIKISFPRNCLFCFFFFYYFLVTYARELLYFRHGAQLQLIFARVKRRWCLLKNKNLLSRITMSYTTIDVVQRTPTVSIILSIILPAGALLRARIPSAATTATVVTRTISVFFVIAVMALRRLLRVRREKRGGETLAKSVR